jgi:hypothetical protein
MALLDARRYRSLCSWRTDTDLNGFVVAHAALTMQYGRASIKRRF